MASKQTNKEIRKPNLTFPRAYTHVLITGLNYDQINNPIKFGTGSHPLITIKFGLSTELN